MTIAPDDDERWWTAAELSAVIGKTERWITDQCESEDSTFPHHRVGRDLRFSPRDRALIDEMTARGRGPAALEQAANDDVLERALQGVRRRNRSKSTAAAAASS